MWHREILSIALMNLILFFALLAVHEIGHSAAGMLLGCKYEKFVLIDSNLIGPYTEMYCSNIDSTLIFISGLLITASFSAMLLLGAPTRNLFLTSIGLSIIFSSMDMSIASNIQQLLYPMASMGFMVTAAGEYFMASNYAKNSFNLDLLDIEAEFS